MCGNEEKRTLLHVEKVDFCPLRQLRDLLTKESAAWFAGTHPKGAAMIVVQRKKESQDEEKIYGTGFGTVTGGSMGNSHICSRVIHGFTAGRVCKSQLEFLGYSTFNICQLW